MKKNVLYISPMQARALALEAANVTSARFDSQKLLESGSLYELEFTTEEMHYTCYIDAVSGEALGLDFFPVPVETYPSYYEDRRRTAQSDSASATEKARE